MTTLNTEFNVIVSNLDVSEAATISSIHQFIEHNDAAIFTEFTNTTYIQTYFTSHNREALLPLISYAILKGYQELVGLLIALGVDVNTVSKKSENGDNKFVGLSPTMFAVMTNQSQITGLLLNNNPDLSIQSAEGLNVLMLVGNQEIGQQLMESVKTNDILDLLLSQRCVKGLNPYTHALIRDLTVFAASMLEDYLSFTDSDYENNGANCLKKLQKIQSYGYEGIIKFLPINYVFEFIKKDQISAIQFLFENGYDVLTTNSKGASLLMVDPSRKMYELILATAQQQNKLAELLALELPNHVSALSRACARREPEIVKMILESCPEEREREKPTKRHFLRVASFEATDPAISQAFHQICLSLREKERVGYDYFRDNKFNLTANSAHYFLFGTYLSEEILSKEAAVKKALSQFFSLLSSPDRCLPYLKFLDAELERYSDSKCELDSSSYHFQVVDSLHFPIPNENFVGIKKNSHLPKYLITLFKQYNLGSNPTKWIGFIGLKTSRAISEKGGFFTECRLGAGLWHNKLAHMLQQAILVYAFENDEIDLSYQENGEHKKLTISDITHGMFSVNTKDNEKPWAPIRDTHYAHLSFTDPHFLGSLIMRHGQELGFPTLAQYLIDSFCKGVRLQLEARNKVGSSQHDMDEFMQRMNDLRVRFFNNNSGLVKYSIFREIQRGRLKEESFTKSFAVIEKNYVLNTEFKPRLFGG